MLNKKSLGILIVSCFFAGCASNQLVPFPDQSKDIENTDLARIYVVRPSIIGTALPMTIRDNGKKIGRTFGRGYLSWEREPGKIEIQSESENTSVLKLNVMKGNTYFVKQSIYPGFFICRSSLFGLSAEEGKKILKKCKAPKLTERKD